MDNSTSGAVLLNPNQEGTAMNYWNVSVDKETIGNIFDSYPQSLLYFGAISCIVFTIVGVPGNVSTILALLVTPRLRNATSAFIINLCVVDAFYCGFSLPLAASTFLERRWPYGESLCTTFALIRYCNAAVSLFTVVGIAINRYVLIVHPTTYGKLCTKITISLCILLLWGLSFLIIAPTAAGVWGAFRFDPEVGTCSIVKVNGKSPKSAMYVMAFGVPSVIFIFCYTKMFVTVRKSEMKLNTRRCQVVEETESRFRRSDLNCCYARKKKVDAPFQGKSRRKLSKDMQLLRVILVIFVTYVLCYFPLVFVKIFKTEKSLPALNVFGHVGAHFSACINPFIYVVISREYRKAYRNLCFCFKVKDISSGSSLSMT